MGRSKKRKKYKAGNATVDPNLPIFAQEDRLVSIYAVIFVLLLSVACGTLGMYFYPSSNQITTVQCAKRARTFKRCSIPACQRIVVPDFLNGDDVDLLRQLFFPSIKS